MALHIMIELLHIVGTAIGVLLTRWLMGLSTPEKDMLWLEQQKWYNRLFRLRFYRGMEYAHQLKAGRILKRV